MQLINRTFSCKNQETKLLPKSNYSLLVTFYLEGENNKVFAPKVAGDKAEELDMDLKSHASLQTQAMHIDKMKELVDSLRPSGLV